MILDKDQLTIYPSVIREAERPVLYMNHRGTLASLGDIGLMCQILPDNWRIS